nr:mas-related G-protein coupled receptor member A1-like [Pogona vitticeps]
MDPAMDSNAIYNGTTGFPNNSTYSPEDDAYFTRLFVVLIFVILVSLFGMVGNGTVIWILGFCMKRNPFTTYILNLSVADFAFLIDLDLEIICSFLNSFYDTNCPVVLIWLLPRLCSFTFGMSQFLLAVISIDRCVCLFFPLWHKCHRPPYLSTTVCATIWIVTFLISAIDFALAIFIDYFELWYYQFVLNTVLCMPAMTISTIAMLINVFFLSPHHKRGLILKSILLALLFFLFFGFPVNASVLFQMYYIPTSPYFNHYAAIGTSINSAINPLIYFLVGRDKKAQSRGRIKKILYKLFQEEGSCKEDVESSLDTHL